MQGRVGAVRCDACFTFASTGFVVTVYVNTRRRHYEMKGHICAECSAKGNMPRINISEEETK